MFAVCECHSNDFSVEKRTLERLECCCFNVNVSEGCFDPMHLVWWGLNVHVVLNRVKCDERLEKFAAAELCGPSNHDLVLEVRS